MQDYESAAYKSLEKLKEKHDVEIRELKEFLRSEFPVKYTLSKELMELRRQEKKFHTVKEYDKAENLKK
jgi:hypothetical protein